MRQVDHNEFQPLGPAKRKEPEKPAENWVQVPGAAPGVVQSSIDGKVKTDIPENEGACWPVLFYGTPWTWGAAIDAIRAGK